MPGRYDSRTVEPENTPAPAPKKRSLLGHDLDILSNVIRRWSGIGAAIGVLNHLVKHFHC
jgi:hypothetical protein